MQRKRNEDGGLAGRGPAVLQRNRTVYSENRLAHNANRAVHNEDHHNIRRFSPKSRFSSNVVTVLLPRGTIKMPVPKQQQHRGNRRHNHARTYERLLHAKRRRQPGGDR